MIVDSSLWSESDCVVKVFMTMLALKDYDHICRCNAYQLSIRARKSQPEVLEALRILSSPDKERMDAQEFEGRRIQAVDEGFLILNGEKYQEMMQKEMERARWRKAQRAQREKKKTITKGPPLPGEIVNKIMSEMGATEAELNRHAESFLPEQGNGGSE